jgi:hypothetical protein
MAGTAASLAKLAFMGLEQLQSTAFSVDIGSRSELISTGNAVESTVDACPGRRTGFHFAGTCLGNRVHRSQPRLQSNC